MGGGDTLPEAGRQAHAQPGEGPSNENGRSVLVDIVSAPSSTSEG